MFTPHVDCSRATMAGVFYVLLIHLLEPRNEVFTPAAPFLIYGERNSPSLFKS